MESPFRVGSRTVAVAFGASGAAWIIGFCLYNSDVVTPIVPLAAGYVAVGSALLAVRDDRLPPTLVGLWAAAVGLLCTLLSQTGPEPSRPLAPIAMLASLVYGTVAFVAWVAIGFTLLSLLSHRTESRP